jgi:hypothetical protein
MFRPISQGSDDGAHRSTEGREGVLDAHRHLRQPDVTEIAKKFAGARAQNGSHSYAKQVRLRYGIDRPTSPRSVA